MKSIAQIRKDMASWDDEKAAIEAEIAEEEQKAKERLAELQSKMEERSESVGALSTRDCSESRVVFMSADTQFFCNFYVKICRHRSRHNSNFPQELVGEPCFSIGQTGCGDESQDANGKYWSLPQAEALRDYLNQVLPAKKKPLKAAKKKS